VSTGLAPPKMDEFADRLSDSESVLERGCKTNFFRSRGGDGGEAGDLVRLWSKSIFVLSLFLYGITEN